MCLSNLEILARYSVYHETHTIEAEYNILSLYKLVTKIGLSFAFSTHIIMERSSFAVLSNKSTNIIML